MLPALLLIAVMLNQVYDPLGRLPGEFAPDIALMVGLFAGLVYTPWSAAALGFGAGLLQDTLTGGWPGIGALSKGLTGLLWTRLWRQMVGDAPFLQLPLLAMLTVVDGALFFGAAILFSPHLPSLDVFFPLLGRQLLSNLVIGPLALMAFAALHRKLTRPRRFGWRQHASAITVQPE
jgi:rod shape-determining protein MreD